MGGKSKEKKKIPAAYSAWTVGYDGLSAIVDKNGALSSRKNVSVQGLLEKGLYRQAAAAAVNSDSAEENIRLVISAYNAACGENRSGYKPEEIYRLFGVQKASGLKFNLL